MNIYLLRGQQSLATRALGLTKNRGKLNEYHYYLNTWSTSATRAATSLSVKKYFSKPQNTFS